MLMDAMHPYFKYIVNIIICGIPRITLEGERSDWEKILTKLKLVNNMLRHHYLFFFVLLGLLGCQSKEPKQPNVLFILADDFGINDISFNVSQYYETPNIDRLVNTVAAYPLMNAGTVFTSRSIFGVS